MENCNGTQNREELIKMTESVTKSKEKIKNKPEDIYQMLQSSAKLSFWVDRAWSLPGPFTGLFGHQFS